MLCTIYYSHYLPLTRKLHSLVKMHLRIHPSILIDSFLSYKQIMRERKMEAEESMLSNFKSSSSFMTTRSSSGKRKKTNAERIGLQKEKR